ncbi:HAD family hydrolase [Streptomyces sp. NPDC088789]|uniref:HAD family hydrolase n=1 Tax=Streptomyces sp. NPDC088789 TaxID=3365899 RepID=UPI0037F12205
MTPETGRTDLVARDAEELARLVAGTRNVLFDFDGPICRLFAGHPAVRIAREQVLWLEEQGLAGLLTEAERASPDPHGVLMAFAARHPGSDLVLDLEERLTRAELEAAPDAWPTAYADALIRTWVAVGARLAIVTNNSARSVEKYLRGRDLYACFAPHIYGRTADLRLLKPNPDLLLKALRAMGAAPRTSLMIGDSQTDYTAARTAGVPFLGYAGNDTVLRRLLADGVPERRILRSLEPLLHAVRTG